MRRWTVTDKTWALSLLHSSPKNGECNSLPGSDRIWSLITKITFVGCNITHATPRDAAW